MSNEETSKWTPQVGDVVCLKSAGASMVIENIRFAVSSTPEADALIDCVYWSGSQVLRVTLSRSVLEPRGVANFPIKYFHDAG